MVPKFLRLAAALVATTMLNSCGEHPPTPGETGQDLPSYSRHAQPASFDIPSLIGKSIDEVRQALGSPVGEQDEPTKVQLELGVDEWSNAFTKDGVELLVNFEPRTRRVLDFFLAGDEGTALMQQGKLEEGATAYSVESVRSLRNPATITGIKIVPRGTP